MVIDVVAFGIDGVVVDRREEVLCFFSCDL
jgi:hypothetical protein